MYVRLAFAVAAHLDPEVLIIDEVLAVGDYEFQQRCMGRIEDISTSGAHGALRLARHAGDHAALQPRLLARRRPGDGRGPSEDVVSRTSRARRARAPRAASTLDNARGRRCAPPLGAGRRLDRRDRARGRRPRADRDRAPLRRARRDRAAVPEDQARQRARGGRLQRARHGPALARDARARHLHVHRLDPAEPPERGRDRPSTSTVASFGGPAARQPRQRADARPLPRPRPGLGDSAKGSSRVSSAAACGRCSTGRPSSSSRAPTRRRSGRPGRSRRPRAASS